MARTTRPPRATDTRMRMSIGRQIQEAACKLGIRALVTNDPTGLHAGWILDVSGRLADAVPLSTGDAADWLLAGGFDGALGRNQAIVHPDRVAAFQAAVAATDDGDDSRSYVVAWADLPAPSWKVPALDTVDDMRAWIDAAGLTRVMRINDIGDAVQLNHDRLAGCTFHYARWSRCWTFAGRAVRPGLMPAVLVEMAADTYGYPDTLIERATAAAPVWTLTGRETADAPAVVLASGSLEHCQREHARRYAEWWRGLEVAPTGDVGGWHTIADTVRPDSGAYVTHRGRSVRVVPAPGLPGTLRVMVDNERVYDTPGTAATAHEALSRVVAWMDAAAGHTTDTAAGNVPAAIPTADPPPPGDGGDRVADPWADVVDN